MDDATVTGRPSSDVRDRLVDAASRCVARFGIEGTTIAAVAREAGYSRQTVYKYFTAKEDLALEGVQRAVEESSERVLARARTARTATGFAVELFLAFHDEITLNPAVSPLIQMLDQPATRKRVLEPQALTVAKHFLEPILEYAPERAADLDEMNETMLRFLISVLTLDSDRTSTRGGLRAYLMRSLVPAIGLPPEREP